MTGASAEADQALAVPVEPFGLAPSGFDPSRGLKRQSLVHIGRRCIREHAGAECNGEIVGMLRQAAAHVTGGNCAFADSDLNILEHLALRAVEAGLTDGLHPDVAARAKANLRPRTAIAMEARSGETERLDGEATTARAEGIAQDASTTPNTEERP